MVFGDNRPRSGIVRPFPLRVLATSPPPPPSFPTLPDPVRVEQIAHREALAAAREYAALVELEARNRKALQDALRPALGSSRRHR